MYEYWLGGAKSLTDKYHAICETYRPPFFCSWKNVWSRVRACPSPHQPDASFVDVRLGLRIMAVQIWFGTCILLHLVGGWGRVTWSPPPALDHPTIGFSLLQLWKKTREWRGLSYMYMNRTPKILRTCSIQFNRGRIVRVKGWSSPWKVWWLKAILFCNGMARFTSVTVSSHVIWVRLVLATLPPPSS